MATQGTFGALQYAVQFLFSAGATADMTCANGCWRSVSEAGASQGQSVSNVSLYTGVKMLAERCVGWMFT